MLSWHLFCCLFQCWWTDNRLHWDLQKESQAVCFDINIPVCDCVCFSLARPIFECRLTTGYSLWHFCSFPWFSPRPPSYNIFPTFAAVYGLQTRYFITSSVDTTSLSNLLWWDVNNNKSVMLVFSCVALRCGGVLRRKMRIWARTEIACGSGRKCCFGRRFRVCFYFKRNC